MLNRAHFEARRGQLLKSLSTPALLMSGGAISRNYPQNVFPFRADSGFLFCFGEAEPDSAAWLDPADGSVTMFLGERTPEVALWHGPTPGFDEMRVRLGVQQVLPMTELEQAVPRLARGRKIATLAVADWKASALANRVCGTAWQFDNADQHGDTGLIDAIVALRLQRTDEEVAEMREAARVTREAHTLTMAQTRVGVHEQHLAGCVEGSFARHGCVPAYGTILSVRGEILHNLHQIHELRDGDLVLLDAGAEVKSGYCADVTRTWPANGRFSRAQRDIYDIVLNANLECIEMVEPGRRYRDVHFHAARVIASGLKNLGLLRGAVEGLVENGAHAMFFPHGVGHLLGLDVHDMESFGDRIAYPSGRRRSTQFGTAYLRLDRDLQPGVCVTIEPGIYFVPAILHHPPFREQFAGQVDFDRAETWLRANHGRGFGGVRVEDDVWTTATGREVLSERIAKTPSAIEEIVGTSA